MIKLRLHHDLKIKNLGQLKYFIGLKVSHSKQGILLCQRKYYLDLLSNTCLFGPKLVITLVDSYTKLYLEVNLLFNDIPAYRRVISQLLYLATI